MYDEAKFHNRDRIGSFCISNDGVIVTEVEQAEQLISDDTLADRKRRVQAGRGKEILIQLQQALMNDL